MKGENKKGEGRYNEIGEEEVKEKSRKGWGEDEGGRGRNDGRKEKITWRGKVEKEGNGGKDRGKKEETRRNG